MELSNWIIFLSLALWSSAVPSGLTGLRWLFPEAKTYTLDLKTNITTGSLLPTQGGSYWTLHAILSVHVRNDTSVAFELDQIKDTVFSSDGNAESSYTVHELPPGAMSLRVPWEANYLQESGMLYEIRIPRDEPIWSANIKRALAISLQLARVNSTGSIYKNSYTIVEPCLHSTCAVEYSGVGTDTVRKWHGISTSARGVGRTTWFSVSPDICNIDIKQPFIGSAERVYRLDDRGLVSLDLESSLEYHTHGHLLSVITGMSLYRDQIIQTHRDETLDLVPTHPAYTVHSNKQKTNTRAPVSQEHLLQKTLELLTSVSESIDNANVTKNAEKIHNMNLINLHDKMSQLSFQSLKSLNNELHVGTSYLNETNKNIFLEVLPHIKSADSAKLVKFLVMDFSAFKLEDATALSLIRKLPFNIKEVSQDLLMHMENLLNLPPDVSKEIRHASILSFATLAFQTYVNGACSSDEFEGYVQKYFRMYTECPKYEDRMVWLQGLANLQIGSVSSYLGPIIQDKNASRHERFLAIWATMPVARFTPEMTSSLYWPILTDAAEHTQLRVSALLMLLYGDQSPSRILSLDRYVSSCGDGHLKNLWYTTVKNLHKSSYSCYRTISKLLSYVSGRVQKPDDKFWATANHVVDVSDHERQYSAMSQLLTISKPLAGHPEFVFLSLNSNQAGLTTSQISIMIKAEGIKSGLLDHVLSFSAPKFSSQDILKQLSKLKVTLKSQKPVHIEVIINVQGKTVYAIHLSPATENWAKLDSPIKTIVDILNSESHINQQFVQYPLQAEVELPTELGTPVTLQMTWSSFLSVRGTMTTPLQNGAWQKKNDLHLRYHAMAVTSLSSYGPVLNSEHSVRIQQSTLAHAPLKFHLALYFPNFALSWLNEDPTGGVVVHSRTQVAVRLGEHEDLGVYCPRCVSEYTIKAKDTNGSEKGSNFFFDCERPLSSVELLEKILDSNRANHNFFSSPRPSLMLVHVLYLLSAPPPGSCGLMLGSRFPFHVAPGTRLDTSLQVDWAPGQHPLEYMQLAFEVTWRDVSNDSDKAATTNATFVDSEKDDTERLNIKGLLKIEAEDEKNESVALEILAFVRNDTNATSNWQFCMRQNQTNGVEYDSDLSPRSVPYHGRVEVTFTRDPSEECRGGMEIAVEYSGKTVASQSGVGRYFEMDLRATNEPISSGLHLPQIFTSEKNDGGNKEDSSKSKTEHLHKTASLVDRNGQTVLTIDNSTEWHFALGDLSADLDRFTTKNFYKRFGIYQECRIQDRTIVTLDGSVTELQGRNSSQTLILAECTSTPRFAVFRQIDGGFTFSSGESVISLSPHSELKVNGIEQTFPYTDNFFRVKKQAAMVTVEFVFFHWPVYFQASEVTLLVPDGLVDQACGECAGDYYA